MNIINIKLRYGNIDTAILYFNILNKWKCELYLPIKCMLASTVKTAIMCSDDSLCYNVCH